MIDFHAHVLPGCDHGSDGLETSLKQLALAREAGIETLIATPHFYPQKEPLDDFLQRRNETYELLMKNHTASPEIIVGAEVNLCQGLDRMKGLEKVCISGTRLILIEMPLSYWSQSLEETLLRIQDDDELTVVLAHVDRYDARRIERLLDYGFLAQINAESLVRFFGKRQLLSWIDQGSVVALGSDIHGFKTGYSDFSRAVRGLKDRADLIFKRTKTLLDEAAI